MTKKHRTTEEEMEGPTSSWGSRNRKHTYTFLYTMVMNALASSCEHQYRVGPLEEYIWVSAALSTVAERILLYGRGLYSACFLWVEFSSKTEHPDLLGCTTLDIFDEICLQQFPVLTAGGSYVCVLAVWDILIRSRIKLASTTGSCILRLTVFWCWNVGVRHP
jgi:hypothetical protein